MNCVRVPLLDLPEHIRVQINDSISSNNLVETDMGKYSPRLEDVLSKINDSARQDYIKSIYSGYKARGFTLGAELEKCILEYYSSFFSTLDEEPKITIKVFTSDAGLPLHSDKKQSCSLTTLISGEGPITEWYEIDDEFKDPYYQDGELKGNSLPMPHEVRLVEERLLKEWETYIFNHRAIHKVNTSGLASKRIMLSAGWLNTPCYVIEQKYKEWKPTC